MRWHRLSTDFPNDPEALVTACRGALLRMAGHNETPEAACARSFSKHGHHSEVTFGKIRHRVYCVIGRKRELFRSPKREKPDRGKRAQPVIRRRSTSSAVSPDEARASFASILDKLDD